MLRWEAKRANEGATREDQGRPWSGHQAHQNQGPLDNDSQKAMSMSEF